MLISYNWLQAFFANPLPAPNVIKEAIENHIFEVENMTKLDNGDTIFELDVLPNRASDCLSHLGIAKEVSAILSLSLLEFKSETIVASPSVQEVEVAVKTDACQRYMSRRLEGVKIDKSPLWLTEKIKIMGGKSINNIVDLTNFILFDLGQPMHVFDADKVEGQIIIRQAEDGETMVTLDGKELTLTTEDVVIADSKGVLALAGVKGGQKAEVSGETKNIIVEAANFKPGITRRSAARHNLRTDAVKRFENNLSTEMAEVGLEKFTQLVKTEIPTAKISSVTDVYSHKPQEITINITPEFITSKLGLEIDRKDVVSILKRLHLEVKDTSNELVVTIPFNRPDLGQKEDLVEEVGRLYGYDKIISVLPNKNIYGQDDIIFRVAQKLRQVLLEAGFNEIYDYTFVASGEVELANPLAADNPFLKTNLTTSFLDKINFNLKHLVFDHEAVAMFNIGTVFTAGAESKNIVIGVSCSKPKFHKNNQQVEEVIDKIETIFGVNLKKFINRADTYTVIEFPLSVLTASQKDFEYDLQDFLKSEVKYKPISVYPRIIRDVAVFVPAGTKPEDVRDNIKQVAGEILVEDPILFDEFTKEGDSRTSLAFRLIFQKSDRTLVDSEVNDIMSSVHLELENRGYEVR